MAPAAEERDVPSVRLRLIGQQGANVNLPEPALVGRIGGQVHKFFDVRFRRSRVATGEKARHSSLQGLRLPTEKIPPLPWSPLREVGRPAAETAQKLQNECRSPTDARI